jgi:hypothetical protein
MTQTVVLEHIYFDQRCTQGPGGKGEGKYRTPHANFKTLNLKNAIKPKTGGPPLAIFPESLDPPRDLCKNFRYPPTLDFQHVSTYDFDQFVFQSILCSPIISLNLS